MVVGRSARCVCGDFGRLIDGLRASSKLSCMNNIVNISLDLQANHFSCSPAHNLVRLQPSPPFG